MPHFHFSHYHSPNHRDLHSFPTRRSSDLTLSESAETRVPLKWTTKTPPKSGCGTRAPPRVLRLENSVRYLRHIRYRTRSEEHTSELQSRGHIVCRLLLEKKKRVVNRRSGD